MHDETRPPMSRPRVAAGALFFDAQGRILLVKPTYKEGWDIPGGYVEPGETPYKACVREVNEELGLRRGVGRLLVVDWAPSPTDGDKVLFVFNGGNLTHEELGEVHLPQDELAAFDLFEEAGRKDALTDRLEKRISCALRARSEETVFYLENGTLP